MKILAIGDPHGSEKVKRIPMKNVDLILLTGDIGKADLARKIYFENYNRKQQGLPELKETKKEKQIIHREIHYSTIDLLRYLSKHAPVYTIQGNVGIPTLANVREDKERYGISLPCTRILVDKMPNVNLVKNRLRLVQGLRVGFLEFFVDTCWVRNFRPKDYKERIKKAKKQTDKARRILKRFSDLDILICHQPPYGILDKVNFPEAPKYYQGKHAGSQVILEYIKKKHPRLVLCGHIHEGKGRKKIGKTEIFNLGCCGNYKIFNF